MTKPHTQTYPTHPNSSLGEERSHHGNKGGPARLRAVRHCHQSCNAGNASVARVRCSRTVLQRCAYEALWWDTHRLLRRLRHEGLTGGAGGMPQEDRGSARKGRVRSELTPRRAGTALASSDQIQIYPGWYADARADGHATLGRGALLPGERAPLQGHWLLAHPRGRRERQQGHVRFHGGHLRRQ